MPDETTNRAGNDAGAADDRLRGVALESTPMVLAELHRSLPVGATVTLHGPDRPPGEPTATSRGDGFDAFDVLIRDVVVGAGFEVVSIDRSASPGEGGPPAPVRLRVRRAFTLADTVGPSMRLLTCGLNPSLHAAESGVAFSRPGNRFWPAALAAGLASRDRDPDHALRHHGLGLTDLVKRATRRADELDVEEYRGGLARVERLVEWLAPQRVCFVGLAGWRAAVDRRAVAGWQRAGLGGRPLYLMPSTSGLNARTSLDELAEHLGRASDNG